MKQWWFLHNGLVFAHYLPLSIWCSNMIMPILGTQASVPLIQKEDVVSKLNSSWNEWGKPKPGAEWKSKFGKLKKGEGGLCSRCVYPGSPYMWVSSKKKRENIACSTEVASICILVCVNSVLYNASQIHVCFTPHPGAAYDLPAMPHIHMLHE